MKAIYFDTGGHRVSRARWQEQKNRLFLEDRFGLRRKTGKNVSHIIAVEYWEEGLFFLVDKLLRGKDVYPYARTHARAYIHARHSH